MTQTMERVAVVTGASRGGGRAIALALGRAGWTVFLTGRSSEHGEHTEGLPGTVEEVAREVTSVGGRGIGIRCDHRNDDEVEAFFARVREEGGRLDLLVNNAWGGYEHYDLEGFSGPFWEQPFEARWKGMFEVGLRSTLFASRLAVGFMRPARRGLIVHTVWWDRGLYLRNLFYDVAKASLVRAAFGMATELRDDGIAVLALAPGFMRTERVLAAHAAQPFDLSRTESPAYLGRAVVALAQADDVMRWSGQVVAVGELAPVYGFTDEDGRQPGPFRIDE